MDIGKAVREQAGPVHGSGRMRSAPTEWGQFRRKLLPNDLGISSYPLDPGPFPDLGPSSHPIHPGSTNPPIPHPNYLILITSPKHPFPSSSFPSLLSTLFDFSIRKINLKKPCYSLYGNLKT